MISSNNFMYFSVDQSEDPQNLHSTQHVRLQAHQAFRLVLDDHFIRLLVISYHPLDRGYIDNPGAMVVFATPGMLHAGLSLQIFKKWAPNENNLVIMPGNKASFIMRVSVSNKTPTFQVIAFKAQSATKSWVAPERSSSRIVKSWK